MANTKNIISILALATCTAVHVASSRENDVRTFAGAELDLVLAADNGEVSFNGIDSLNESDRETLLEEFKVIRLRGRNYLDDGFYLLGEGGNIDKFITATEPLGAVVASVNGERYFVSKIARPNFNLTPVYPVAKEVYNSEGTLLWSYEIVGYPRMSDDLSTVCVYNYRYGSEENPNIHIITNSGALIKTYHPNCGVPFQVSRDGENIIIADKTDGDSGTRVFTKRGNLLFTLDPEYRCNLGSGRTGGLILYGSSKYIVQACRKGDNPEDYLQVYDGHGSLLWQKSFGISSGNIRFEVSANDEYLLVYYLEPNAGFEVFNLANGTPIRKVSIDGKPPGGFFRGGVSADSSEVYIVFTKYLGKAGVPNSTFDSTLFIFKEGTRIAEFRNKYDLNNLATGAYGVRFSRDGKYVVVTDGKGFRLFSVGQRR